MRKILYRFWYSAKQAEVRSEPTYHFYDGPFSVVPVSRLEVSPQCFVTIDGKEVEYTECCDAAKRPSHKCAWDDAVLLGEADISQIRLVPR